MLVRPSVLLLASSLLLAAGPAPVPVAPLAFTAESGGFAARGAGYSVHLSAEGAALTLNKSSLALRVRGANPGSRPTALDRLPGVQHFFIGKDPAGWRRNVATFGKVAYEGVLPGIDLLYYGTGKQLEYDFAVAPGADPASIAVEITEGWKARVTAGGELEIADGAGGKIQFARPVSYQMAGAARESVESEYFLYSPTRFGFRVGKYDRTRALVIDPVVIWGTYLGGHLQDEARAVKHDGAGNVWVTGYTNSGGFPVTNNSNCQPGTANACGHGSPTPSPAPWAFVTKLDPTGATVLFSAYLGGANSVTEGGLGDFIGGTYGFGLALDPAGNVYIAGRTGSAEFPVTGGAIQTVRSRIRQVTWPGVCAPNTLVDSRTPDAFVTKLSATGQLMYSTYLGGSGYDSANGIAVNAVGDMFVTGTTTSRVSYSFNFTGCSFDAGQFQNFGFPVTSTAILGNVEEDAGHYKGFLTKIASNGTLAYSTYIGLAAPPSVTGLSSPFIVGTSVAIDSSDNAYVAGYTRDPRFGSPGCNGCSIGGSSNQYDAFVTKINPAVSGTAGQVYLKVFGGSAADYASGIAVDAAGNAYVAGTTDSVSQATDSGFPATVGSYQPARIGPALHTCGFVAKLNGGGGTTYATHLCASGGNASLGALALHGPSGTAIVAGNAYSGLPLIDSVAFNASTGNGAFAARVNSAGSGLLFSSFLAPSGGQNNQNSTAYGVSVDDNLNAYFTGNSGGDQNTLASDGAFQQTFGGNGDAFVLKLNLAQAPPATIAAQSGVPQTAAVGTAFASPLSVILRDAAGQPSPGLIVVFRAPASGASGTFAGGLTTVIAMTNAQGIATSPVFTANATAGAYNITASTNKLTAIGLPLYNLPIGSTVAVSSGAGQSTRAGTAFAATLQAIVRNASAQPLAGVPVTFTAPGSGASATFAGTATVLTNAQGIAISPALTANAVIGSYNVNAGLTGLPAVSANFGLTNLSPNSAPVAVSVSPNSSSTAAQSLAFTFSDVDGGTDLNILNILINSFLDGRNSCYIAYVRSQNILYLINDAGTALQPAITLGTAQQTSNSQCAINGTGSGAVVSGNNLTLTLNMTFTTAFGGRRIIYGAARDVAEANSGWTPLGVKEVPGAIAAPLSVTGTTPAQSTAATQQTVFTFNDNAGFANLNVINVLINNALDGRNACYIAYVRSQNILYLVNDAGDALLPAITPGTTQTVSNSQCTISGTGTSAVGNGNTLTLTVNYTMKPAFRGNRVIWSAARTVNDTGNTGWQATGTWLVP